jgi:hypothetical protein
MTETEAVKDYVHLCRVLRVGVGRKRRVKRAARANERTALHGRLDERDGNNGIGECCHLSEHKACVRLRQSNE